MKNYREESTGVYIVNGHPSYEEVPTYVKCAECGHYVHPDCIKWEPNSFAHYCDDCLPQVLRMMKYEEDGPPESPENYAAGFADNH